MKKLLVFSLLFGAIIISNAQTLKIFPASNNIPHNDDFTAKVRGNKGGWKDLYEYEVQVNSHHVQKSSMVYFDFSGSVKMAVKSNSQKINSVKIRPLSYKIPYKVKNNTIYFSLDHPVDISIEINGDKYHNLQVFTNSPETDIPLRTDTNIVYLGPGYHQIPTLKMKSGKSLYLAGGAVLNGKVLCDSVKNVRIFGRGILYHGQRGVEITNSSNITIDNIIVIDPTHYTVYGGASKNIHINKLRSFSCRGWSDGIDLMSCSDVFVNGVFMRNSDDCIAIYGHRWSYYGDSRNIVVKNSTLWADVAHPIMIGTHGDPEPGKSEVLENMKFENIDILEQNEFQIDYQGCMAINVSDENLARNIRFENIRVEDFTKGQLVNLRVTFNKKYAKAPGRGIENVYFKNIDYNGKNANISIIEGYSPTRAIKNITFQGLRINGKLIAPSALHPGYMKFSDFARFYEGLYVSNLKYIDPDDSVNVVKDGK